MSLESLEYLLFLLGVLVLQYVVGRKLRWALLLAASYLLCYIWDPRSLVLLAGVTLVTFMTGILLSRVQGQRQRRAILLACIVLSLAPLFFYKYAGFFLVSEHAALPPWARLSRLLMPLGLSFFTLQALGYAIDVYRGTVVAERHPGYFALFVSFFPCFTAGPIERAGHMLQQFRSPRAFAEADFVAGLRRIVWGCFKKLVIAEQAAVVVNGIYDSPEQATGTALLIATYLFALQIYCDFSGYADIAFGSARVLGFSISPNFDFPYLAHSVSDFWRRWHISLTSWFRDYLYIPLGGNRVPLWRQCGNILMVFLVSGLWHGANWTFLAWGLYHGAAMAGGLLRRKIFGTKESVVTPLRHVLQVVLTFHIVLVSWVFFRAQSLADAFLILARIPSDLARVLAGSAWLREPLSVWIGNLVLGKQDLVILLLTVLVFAGIEFARTREGAVRRFQELPLWCRWPLYYLLVLGVVTLGKFDGHGFIYSQF